jgi:hypothetical protein
LAEIEKALKKYYGVGAETLDEMAEDEPIELLVSEDKEITEGDQEASVIKFVNQIIWEALQGSRHGHPLSSRRKTNCASATASTASCIRRRCRRSSSAIRPPSSPASRSCRG